VWLSLPLSVAFLAPRLRALAPVLAGAVAVLAALWIAAAALASTTADAGWGGRLLLAGPGGRGDLAARAGDVASLESHLAASEAALAMIASRPLTGFGFGSEIFAEQKWRHRPRWSFTDPAALAWPGTPHDSLLYLGVAAGLPGIAAGLAVLAAVWQSLRRARRGPPPQSDLALCVRAAFVVTLMNALFVDLVFFVYAQILLFALVGLVASGALVPRPVPD
jgi:hypothetical protein